VSDMAGDRDVATAHTGGYIGIVNLDQQSQRIYAVAEAIDEH
jgi:hypothetical protein